MTNSIPKILALIPARSGSKRVENKNIRLLGGKPLITYTIEEAKKSSLINRIIVSTDNEEIAKIALKYNAEVPFLRPKEISSSDSTEYEFHIHAVNWLKENENYIPDYIVNLYPTTPFRKSSTIDNAISLILNDENADTLRSLKKVSEHPNKMWKFISDSYVTPYIKSENKNFQTLSYQLFEEVYIQNASIYVIKKSVLDEFKSTIGKKIIGFVMDEFESIDINYEIDFKLAETYLNNY